jgi:hypothetical protein
MTLITPFSIAIHRDVLVTNCETIGTRHIRSSILHKGQKRQITRRTNAMIKMTVVYEGRLMVLSSKRMDKDTMHTEEQAGQGMSHSW